MAKLSRTLLESAAALALGFVLIGSLVFALAYRAEAHNKDTSPQTATPGLEVRIGANGSVLVRGAEVTNVTDDVITARTEWSEGALTWSVRTDGDTELLAKDGSSHSLGDIDVGEIISFAGSMHDGALSVDASVVKDWSDAGDGPDKTHMDAKVHAESRFGSFMKHLPFAGWFHKK